MMRHTLATLVVLSALVGVGCSGATADDTSRSSHSSSSSASARPGRVSGTEAQRLVQEEHATLLDVRTPEEYASGHVEGSVNIPVQVLSNRMSEVDHDRPVVVYCRSGARSSSAKGMLEAQGYTVYDLGPMSAWSSR